MRVKLSELRQVIQEELTKHNEDKLKSIVRSAITCAKNYVEGMKFGERDDEVTIKDLLRVTKELEAPAKWLKGKGHPDADILFEMLDLLEKLGKTMNPFKRLTTNKRKQGEALEPIVNKLLTLAYNRWKLLPNDPNFDDDLAQQTYTYEPGAER